MKSNFVLLCCYLSICQPSYADNNIEIECINKQVAQLEQAKNQLNVLEIKLLVGEAEATPPELMYYYKPENMDLVMLEVSVGHEIFSTQHSYYFNNAHIIKYVKESFNHPDSPPKKEIIYNEKGGILFKNIDKPDFSEIDVLKLFNKNINAFKAFSKY